MTSSAIEGRKLTNYEYGLTIRIDRFRKSDPDRAHVLLHSLAKIYDHTPNSVREVLLRPWRDKYRELVAACLADHD